MRNKFIKLTLSALLLSIASIVDAKNIAITFDDLPANRNVKIDELSNLTNKIMRGLNKNNIKVVGFVNEEKLHLDNAQQRIEILKRWIANGNELGNHTYSHISLNATPLKEYEKQILMGEEITKQLMLDAGLSEQYFRHPYLHTGLTKEVREEMDLFFKAHGYQVAPVTYDTDDWMFDRLYVEALSKKDLVLAQEISNKYLDHTKRKFNFYDEATRTIFDREINQIWLLHANSINADNIDSLVKIAVDHGFSFVSLQEALKDKAYITADNYYLDYGVSWLYRWDYSNGLKVDWKNEPEPEFSNSTTSIYSLEKDYSKKIGVYAIDTNTGEVFSHRANEFFPMQSTFKLLAASYLLKESETNPGLLNKEIVITENDMVPWHPITGKHLPNGKMSLKDLAQAAMSYSDNPAVNLIMKELGGPKAVTYFANSIGNNSFNVEHYEAKLDSNPDSSKDISTAEDMAYTLKKILLGDTLSKKNRNIIFSWMQQNTTGEGKIRGGLPSGWEAADKTGSGAYGIVNDIGIVWSTTCKPIVLAIYTVSNNESAEKSNQVISKTTKLVLRNFAKNNSCFNEKTD